jgi:hypothetical protein
MGLFWDLIQQSQISQQRDHAGSLEMRVVQLERELAETWRIQNQLLLRLETRLGEDLNSDGRVGGSIS